MSRRQLQLAALGLAVLVIAVVGYGLLTRPPQATPPVEIASLEQAVEVGLLDEEVLADLRTAGEARALIHLDVEAILAPIRQTLGEDRAAVLIDAMAAAFKANKSTLLAALGPNVELVEDFERLGVVIVTIRSEEALLAALRSQAVAAVTADRPMPLDRSAAAPGRAAAPVLPLAPSIYEGAGVLIGVLDTGVDDARYPEYFPAGSVAGRLEAAPDDFTPDDDGHGSHVASTVLLMAPQARLYVADVFQQMDVEVDGKIVREPRAPNAITLAGMDWIIGLKQQGENIRAVNLSLGGGHYPPAICVDRMHFAEAYAAGIIPVVSAGNFAYHDDRGRPTTEFQPGVGGNACNEAVLSVGAVSAGTCADGSVDEVAEFSQSSPALDLLAPGRCIEAAGGFSSGTSMAAPHVAGAVAVLANAKPDATAFQIWESLVSVGPFIPDSRSGVTRRRLDIPAAVDHLLGSTVPRPTPVVNEIRAVALGAQRVTPTEAIRPGQEFDFEPVAVRNVGTVAATYGIFIEAPSGGVISPASPDWFSSEEPAIELEAGALGEVLLSVRPPGDTEPGVYGATVRVADRFASDTSATFDVTFVVFDDGSGEGPGTTATPGTPGTPGTGDSDDLGELLQNPLVIIAGIVLVLFVLRRMFGGRRPPATPPAGPPG